MAAPSNHATPRPAASRLRWVVIGFVFLATVINYLDRQTLSVTAPVIRRDLGFGDLEYSRIVSLFLLAYTIMNGVSGPLIDRLGTRKGYALCMLWWSGASVLHGFARSALSLGVFRFLLGMGEAGNWPAAVKVVSEWFPEEERALASGLFNSGAAIGAVLAPPLIAWVALRFHWTAAFVAIGCSGFLWLLLWWALYRPPAAREPTAERPPFRPLQLIREPFVWSLTVAKIFFDPAWYFYVFWFPQYLSSARHFDLEKIGMYSWIPFLTAGIGNLAGGAFSAAMIRRGASIVETRRVTLTIFCFLMTAAIPAVLAGDAFWAIVFVSIATFGYTGGSANMLAIPADAYPPEVVGSIWGFASMGSGFGGMLFTLIAGSMIARFSYAPAFFLFGLCPLVCAAILLLITTKHMTPGANGFTTRPTSAAP